MKPKISIIIPCYNLEYLVDKCLKSLSNNVSDSIELVFINDGSTDKTLEKINNFCFNRRNCIVIDQENSGVSNARNAGQKIAKGDYIYLLDGDDELTGNAVETMLKLTKDLKYDVIISPNYIKVKDKISSHFFNLPFGVFSVTELYSKIKVFPTAPQLLYKSEIIKKHNILFDPNIILGEVYDFTLKFFRHCNNICVYNEKLQIYNIHVNSTSNQVNIKKLESLKLTMEKYVDENIYLHPYDSFWTTNFKIFTTFSYSKIVKNNLTSKPYISLLKDLYSNKYIKLIIKKTAFNPHTPLKDRLLALFIFSTKQYGVKLLALLIKIFRLFS